MTLKDMSFKTDEVHKRIDFHPHMICLKTYVLYVLIAIVTACILKNVHAHIPMRDVQVSIWLFIMIMSRVFLQRVLLSYDNYYLKAARDKKLSYRAGDILFGISYKYDIFSMVILAITSLPVMFGFWVSDHIPEIWYLSGLYRIVATGPRRFMFAQILCIEFTAVIWLMLYVFTCFARMYYQDKKHNNEKPSILGAIKATSGYRKRITMLWLKYFTFPLLTWSMYNYSMNRFITFLDYHIPFGGEVRLLVVFIDSLALLITLLTIIPYMVWVIPRYKLQVSMLYNQSVGLPPIADRMEHTNGQIIIKGYTDTEKDDKIEQPQSTTQHTYKEAVNNDITGVEKRI